MYMYMYIYVDIYTYYILYIIYIYIYIHIYIYTYIHIWNLSWIQDEGLKRQKKVLGIMPGTYAKASLCYCSIAPAIIM